MMSSAFANSSGSSTAPPVMSSGLCGVPKLGSTETSAFAVASGSGGSGTPSTCRRSAAISQAPPETETSPSPFASDHAGARDHVGGEQQFLDRIHPHDAELAANAVEHAVIAHQ